MNTPTNKKASAENTGQSQLQTIEAYKMQQANYATKTEQEQPLISGKTLFTAGIILFSVAALGMGFHRTHQLAETIGWQAWALDGFLLGCLVFFAAIGITHALHRKSTALFACIAAASVLLVIGGAA